MNVNYSSSRNSHASLINNVDRNNRVSQTEGFKRFGRLLEMSRPDPKRVVLRNCEAVSRGEITLSEKTQLFKSVRKGELEVIINFLSKNKDYDLFSLTENNMSLLSLASSKGKVDIIQVLLEAGANIHGAACEKFNVPLLQAIFYNQEDAVKLLLKCNAQINVIDSLRFTPLMFAAYHNKFSICKILIESFKAVVNWPNGKYAELSPLGCAIHSQNIKIVKLFLKAKADVTLSDSKGNAAIHYVASETHQSSYAEQNMVGIMDELVKAGADLNAVNLQGDTVLILAARRGLSDLTQQLIKLGARINDSNAFKSSPLHEASAGGYINIVRQLIEGGADINQPGRDEMTPLIFALGNSKFSVVEKLLNCGADVLKPDVQGRTALHYLATTGTVGSKKILTKLLKANLVIDYTTYISRTPLHYAACADNLGMMSMLIDHNADTSATDKDGLTCLHFAALEGSLEVANFLIKKVGNVDQQDLLGRAPLHHALKSVEMVELLLDNNANISAVDKRGVSALHLAAGFGYSEVISLLVSRGMNVDTKDSFSRSPLHYAANTNKTHVMQVLHNHKACIDEKDIDGYTALHFAIENNHKDAVAWLIKSNATIDLPNKLGYTPLHFAVGRNDIEMVKILCDNKANIEANSNREGKTALHMAAASGWSQGIVELIKRGAVVGGRDRDGKSALHYAVIHNNANAVQILLNYKASVIDKNNNGATALHFAITNNNIAIAEMLIDNGADINETDILGLTALHVSVVLNNCQVARLLLNRGAVVDTKTFTGETTLSCATADSKKEVMNRLLFSSIKVNLKDAEGMTELHHAAKSGTADNVELLKKNGADVGVADNSGKTPLHHAVSSSETTKAKLKLLANSHTVKAKDSKGLTALHYAAINNHLDGALMLIPMVDVKIRDNLGRTPLHYAALQGHDHIANALLSAGAEKNPIDSFGFSPLALAIESSKFSMVTLLIEWEADVNQYMPTGCPLIRAIINDSIPIVTQLIEAGAGIRNRHNFMGTPIEIAFEYGNLEIIKTLVTKIVTDENKNIETINSTVSLPGVKYNQ